MAWWEWSCWGDSLINGAPPSSHTFLPLGLGSVSCRRHNMQPSSATVGHCAIDLDRWGATSPPGFLWQSPGGGQGGLVPWKLQRICFLWYLNLGLILLNNTWMVIYFSCALQYKVTGKSLRSKIFNSQVSYEKKMCMFCSSSWIIFLKFKRQAI